MSKKKEVASPAVDSKPIDPKTTVQEEPPAEAEFEGLLGGLYCSLCKCELQCGFASTGKREIFHEKSVCPNSGKHFELPTIKLQELKA